MTQKIHIIGAGVVGICTALELINSGHEVTLVDQDSPGSNCSKGNAGHFGTNLVFPVASAALLPRVPGMLLNPLGPLAIRWRYLMKLTPWLIRFLLSTTPARYELGCQSLAALNEVAMENWYPLLEQSGAMPMLCKRGTLGVYENEKSFSHTRTARKIMDQYKVPYEVLQRNEIQRKEPELNDKAHKAIFYSQTSHVLDPYELSLKLFSLFEKLGGKFSRTRVNKILPHKKGCQLQTNNDQIEVEKLVICAGAWSTQLLGPLGYKIPLDTERGYHYMLPNPGYNLKVPVVCEEQGFIMTPMSKGLRLAGTVEFGGLKLPPNYRRAEMMYDHARRFLPDLNNAGAEPWMGFRPSLPDSLPVIGCSDEHPWLYFNFGHQHLGLTLAAITAKTLAACLENKEPTINMNAFSYQRWHLSSACTK
jgi:glycine/D-amino acid oxidase-like deaminating enzyme